MAGHNGGPKLFTDEEFRVQVKTIDALKRARKAAYDILHTLIGMRDDNVKDFTTRILDVVVRLDINVVIESVIAEHARADEDYRNHCRMVNLIPEEVKKEE